MLKTVGVEASGLVRGAAVAVAGALTASDVGRTLHAYPALSEGERSACQAIM